MSKYLSDDVINNIFSYHPPTNSSVADLHADIRAKCRELAHWFNHHLPACPEATLAIRQLQQAMMYGNSAVAQHGINDGPTG